MIFLFDDGQKDISLDVTVNFNFFYNPFYHRLPVGVALSKRLKFFVFFCNIFVRL